MKPAPRAIRTAVGVVACQLLGGVAAAAGPTVVPWPRCAPLCAHAPTHGPRITAIYVSTDETHGRPFVIVDAFASRLASRSVNGQLCYEARHDPAEPGCVVTSITYGRHVGAGVWWLRFRTPVYDRDQMSGSNAHAIVRSYWFGVSVPVGNGSAQGSRAGRLRVGPS